MSRINKEPYSISQYRIDGSFVKLLVDASKKDILSIESVVYLLPKSNYTPSRIFVRNWKEKFPVKIEKKKNTKPITIRVMIVFNDRSVKHIELVVD